MPRAHCARWRTISIEKTGGAGATRGHAAISPSQPPPLMRRFLCGLAQACALPVILTLETAQWLGIFVTYLLLAGEGLGFWAQMAALLGVYVAHQRGHRARSRSRCKWVVLGRTRPGRYPLWGVYYFRWWFAKRLEPLVHIKWLQGSPMMRRYLRLLGARVGGDVDHRRHRRRRARPRRHRARHDDRLEDQDRQCRGDRQRAGDRRGHDRRRRLYRRLLHDRARRASSATTPSSPT